MAGKGSKPRPTNLLKFRSNFDLIKGFSSNNKKNIETVIDKKTNKTPKL